MNPAKIVTWGAFACAIAAAVFAALRFSAATQARASLAALADQNRLTAARLAAADSRLQAESKHAQLVEADNAQLATALQRARSAQATATAKAAPPPTRAAVDAHFRQAQALAKDGDPAEALRALLACEEEYRQLGGRTRTQTSMVIYALGQLAERSPEALANLRAQLATFRGQVAAGPDGAEAIGDLAAVTRALKDSSTLLALYDQSPDGDPRRRSLAIYAFGDMLAAQRYTDAAASRTWSSMISGFEMQSDDQRLANLNPGQAQMVRQHAVDFAAQNLEVLAGTGDTAHAQALISRVLAYDNTPETLATLQSHLARAGHPELLPAAKP